MKWKPSPVFLLENPKDRGTWQATVHRAAKSRTWLKQLSMHAWTVAHQAPLSFTISQSLLKLRSIESIMLSNHLILCFSFILLPSVFPNFRVFPNESVLHSRWPKYWRFSISISPSSEYFRIVVAWGQQRASWLTVPKCRPVLFCPGITVRSLGLRHPVQSKAVSGQAWNPTAFSTCMCITF